MEKQSILTLSTIQTIAGKAIRDLKNGGKRETRNVIGLCQRFTQGPVQREFWNMIKKFTCYSGSQYDLLLHRIASSVREEILKSIVVNFGYSTFVNGAKIIRTNHERGMDHCWIQELDLLHMEKEIIMMWNKRGVNVFWVNVNQKQELYLLEQLFSLISHHTRSTFVLLLQEENINKEWIEKAAQLDNIFFLLSPEALVQLKEVMVNNKALFGILRNYLEIDNLESEKREVAGWIQVGAAFAVYGILQDVPCGKQADIFYKTLVSVRKKGTVEIFLCDWQRDIHVVQELILGTRELSEFL